MYEKFMCQKYISKVEVYRKKLSQLVNTEFFEITNIDKSVLNFWFIKNL